MKELEYLSNFFVDTVWMSVCKGISLDDHYFMVILMLKNGILTESDV